VRLAVRVLAEVRVGRVHGGSSSGR
jgi:hypothetical protein